MGAIKDVMAVMKEVLLLADKIDRAGNTLSEISNELRDHDRRLIRLETMVEVARMQPKPSGKRKIESF
jgi:hypoxanthine phosphoribosyltransferase